MPVSGLSVTYTAFGGILLWSGIKGETLSQTLKDVISGKAPATNQEPIGQGGTSTSSASTTAAVVPAGAPAGSPPGAVNGCTGSQTAANKALGQAMAAAYGWATGQEWTALNNVVMSESGWCNVAQNPGSTAYGIGQFLDTTWAGTGYSKTSNPAVQIAAMLKYIKGRYGDPIKAWAFHVANNWY